LSRHHHHHHYLLSQSCERKRGREGGREREREREYSGSRIILAKDEEVKRVGREMRRKNGRMCRHTAGHEDEDRGARREGRK